MFEAKGLITPVLTALDENEKFNPIAYKDFINMLIESGVHGIFPLGTNGEFYAFNNDEKYEIIKTAVEAVNGRVPVYAGTGCVTTKETIEFSLKVKDLGVDCLSVISPYFVSVSQEDIYNHFSAVAKAVDMPILLYNIPARTGNNIDFKTVKKLMEFENIIEFNYNQRIVHVLYISSVINLVKLRDNTTCQYGIIAFPKESGHKRSHYL